MNREIRNVFLFGFTTPRERIYRFYSPLDRSIGEGFVFAVIELRGERFRFFFFLTIEIKAEREERRKKRSAMHVARVSHTVKRRAYIKADVFLFFFATKYNASADPLVFPLREKRA